MPKKYYFQSIYAPFFESYLAMRKSFGAAHNTLYMLRIILADFDQYFHKSGVTQIGITKEQVDQWRQLKINNGPRTLYSKYCTLTLFCKYMTSIGYECYVPRRSQNPKNNYIPYIFSSAEIQRIFQETDKLYLKQRYMDSVLFSLPTLFRMLYATGLRISETLALSNKDVDLKEMKITVRKAKNNKERIVPFSRSLYELLSQYTDYRNKLPVANIEKPDNPFFVSPDGTPCEHAGIRRWFLRVLENSGITYLGAHKGPRIHDFRHTFAVHSMEKMNKAGVDLYTSLPILSAYLGHQHLRATEQYIRLTGEIFPELIYDQRAIDNYIFPKYYSTVVK